MFKKTKTEVKVEINNRSEAVVCPNVSLDHYIAIVITQTFHKYVVVLPRDQVQQQKL